ncbi:MAG: DNA polymerase, partial [Planctomycetota bacterium]
AVHHAHAEWNILRALKLPQPPHMLDTETAARFLDIRDEGFLRHDYGLLACQQRAGFAVRGSWLKEEMRQRIIRRDFSDLHGIVDYCAADAADTLHLAQHQLPRLDAHFWQLIQPLQFLLLDIHNRGLHLDTESYGQLLEHAEEILCRQQDRLHQLGFQGEFNGYEKLTARHHNIAVQRTLMVVGRADILDEYPVYLRDVNKLGWQRRKMGGLFDSGQHEFLTAAAEYHVMLDMLAHDWRQFIDSDHRLRFGFAFPGTSSYRTSPRQPNPLQLPRAFRPILTAAPGHAIVEIDYSCQEVGLAAQWFNDPVLLRLFNEFRLDLYAEIGLAMGQYPTDDPATDPDQRDRMKTSTLSMIYGAGVPGLRGNLKCSETEAVRIINAFHNSFPQLFVGRQRYLDAIRADDRAWNVVSLTRRYQWFKMTDDGAVDTTLSYLNYPVQSGGAMVMARLLMEMPPWVRVVAPCHDAVLIEAPVEGVEDVITTASAVMQHAMDDLFPGVRCRVKAQAAWRYHKKSPNSLHEFCRGHGIELTAPVGWVWTPERGA